MAEKVIHEVRFVETDDGFRIEIRGDKERMKQFGFGPGLGFGRHARRARHRAWMWGWGCGPAPWWVEEADEGDRPEERGEPRV